MKILIGYASKNGCTESCAKQLAQKLTGEVTLIDLKKQAAPDLGDYDVVVIGSPVYAGQIQKAVRSFCTKNYELLLSKKRAFFLCCGSAESTSNYYASAFPPALIANALAAECFGGEMDIDKLKGLDKFIAKMVIKATAKEQKAPPVLLPEAVQRLAQQLNAL